jgi:hypothetical protein
MTRPLRNITAFQALTYLADAYRFDLNNQEKYRQIMALYLPGVRSQADQAVLESLFQDPVLKGCHIVALKEDPVRRDFERELARLTLLESLDVLDLDLLGRHVTSILQPIGIDHIYPDLLLDSSSEASDNTSHEGDTEEEHDEKLQLLSDAIISSHQLYEQLHTDGTTLFDLFHQPTSVPISAIPGNFLIQLGTVEALLHANQCVYHPQGSGYISNEVQLKHYLCALIANDVSRRSKYTLEAFFYALEMHEVQHAFQALLPDFLSSLKLDEMFRLHNQPAFNQALSRTIQLNGQIFNREETHTELKLKAKNAGSIMLDFPHKSVMYTFFSSSASENRMLARCTHSFHGIQNEMKQFPGVLERSVELSLAMVILVSARFLNIKMFKNKHTETKDASFASMFSLSMLIAAFTARLLDANCELPRSNTFNGTP